VLLPLDPCAELGKHLHVSDDGTIRGITPAGEDLIRICRLDRPHLTAYRRLMLDLLAILNRKRGAEAADLFGRLLAYPANLPDLGALRPPDSNARPAGVAASHFARRGRGELPHLY
jgi:hypothetical protein